MSNQKNKLRRGKNVKVLIYIGVIFFFLLLVFGIVAAYIIIDYEYVTGKTVKFGIFLLELLQVRCHIRNTFKGHRIHHRQVERRRGGHGQEKPPFRINRSG